MYTNYHFIFTIILLFMFFTKLRTQAIYDESKVPDYQLPGLFTSTPGEEIKTLEEWESVRRPEIVRLFEEHIYGRVPEFHYETEYEVKDLHSPDLNQFCRVKDVTVTFKNKTGQLKMSILLFLPLDNQKKHPLFLGMNFHGNQAIHPDSIIPLTKNWVDNGLRDGIINNRATRWSRGIRKSRWPVEKIIERGYGLATIYYGDIDPDFEDGFQNGIHGLADPGASSRDENAWGSIAAWAWGMSRAMDYFETDGDIDEGRVILFGHSRLGKAALWSGAIDERFALVISNNSGCGGAALSRREYGETVKIINDKFPHWFCRKFHEYGDRVEALPVDQHMLIALIAPRPVYVASADEDQWADPKGEYLSLYHAGPVFSLYQQDIISSANQPELEDPVVAGNMGYHIRKGKHNITEYDWEQYLDFADRRLLDY